MTELTTYEHCARCEKEEPCARHFASPSPVSVPADYLEQPYRAEFWEQAKNARPVPVSTDDLRKQVNELGALARALFEAQFARCDGGRMPADPTWDDLEPSERDEFWEQARNARHVFGPRSVSVPGGQLREEIAEALWATGRLFMSGDDTQGVLADAALSAIARRQTKANADAAPAVDRSTLQHQITAALHTARNRGYRHPDEADTGDLVDAAMGPVDEWDDALHDDLKDEIKRLREELAKLKRSDAIALLWPDMANEGEVAQPGMVTPDVIEQAARVLFDCERRRFLDSPSGFVGSPTWQHADHDTREQHMADARALASADLLYLLGASR